MFIVYVKIQNSTLPIKCKEMIQDPLIPQCVLLKDAANMEDNIYPDVAIKDISVLTSDVIYYLKGTEKENTKDEEHVENETNTDEESSEDFSTEDEPVPKKRKPRKKRSKRDR